MKTFHCLVGDDLWKTVSAESMEEAVVKITEKVGGGRLTEVMIWEIVGEMKQFTVAMSNVYKIVDNKAR